jgi:hypothetical protein
LKWREERIHRLTARADLHREKMQYFAQVLTGLNSLLNDVVGPLEPGDYQLPGEHPFVYGMTDEAKHTLIARLDEIINAYDYPQF